MARKPKRRQQQTRARRPAAPAAPGTAGSGTATPAAPRPAAAGPRSPQAARVGGGQAFVRAVESSIAPPASRGRGGRIVLDSADPAIPLDRVPYFVSDLKRLGIVGGIMVVPLVLGAEFVIPLLVK